MAVPRLGGCLGVRAAVGWAQGPVPGARGSPHSLQGGGSVYGCPPQGLTTSFKCLFPLYLPGGFELSLSTEVRCQR